jgi:aquaporin Z
VTAAYALGHISGGHFNPAVTLGVLVARRIELREAIVYVVAQVVGAVIAAAVIVVIASGVDGFSVGTGAGESTLAANGFADHSPGGYDWAAALVAEVVLTFFFLLVILGVTGRGAPAGFAPLTIGLTLTLIHLISIPVTNTSVNPARSTGPAVFVGGWAVEQLWMFWLAPLVGAALAGLVHHHVIEERPQTVEGYS